MALGLAEEEGHWQSLACESSLWANGPCIGTNRPLWGICVSTILGPGEGIL